MRDSCEKGAGMRDQDPPFQTLREVSYQSKCSISSQSKALAFAKLRSSVNNSFIGLFAMVLKFLEK